MKKLMIAAAVICAAVASQAATLKWGDGDLSYKDAAAGDNVTLTTFYFGTDAAAKTAYETILALGATDGSKYVFDNFNGTNLKVGDSNFAVYSSDPFSEGSKFGSTVKNIQTGTTYYFASLITADDGKGDVEAYIGNVGAYTAVGSTMSYDQMGHIWGGENGTGDVAWQSVPEPTSGLLLLLGVAGLALRRRRA